MQHLDEGTIHAWLDAQLPQDEAGAVEAHVAECRQCADAVAEARGLIAASSRILMSLDDVPRDVVPKQPMPVIPVMPVAPQASMTPVTAPTAQPAPTPNAVVDLPSRAAARQPVKPVQPVKRAPRRWLSGPALAAAATIVLAVGTFALNRAGSRDLASSSINAEEALRSGPAADSAVLPVGASVPASPTSAAPSPALGAARADEVPPALRRAAPSLAAGQRAEADQSAARGRAPERVDGFSAAKTANSVAANTPARDEVKREAKVADQPVLADQSARFAKERAAVATDSLARQRQLATVPPAPVPPPQARLDTAAPVSPSTRAADAEKPSEQRVTVLRGSAAVATAGTIRGRVTDGNSTPLAGASVTVARTSIGVATSESGDFVLGGVQPGPHSLTVRRVGYEPVSRDITVIAGQTTTADVTLKPAVTSLENVVVTGAGVSRRAERGNAGSTTAPAAPRASTEAPPGAAVTAGQSTAVGCYEMGITPNSQQARLNFRQTPRRVALDAEIVPSNADGVWYRARDLARTGAVPNGLWRPVGTDGIELEWTYGTRFARIRLTGPVGQMMRGTAEELDRANGTGEAGSVVSVRASCAG